MNDTRTLLVRSPKGKPRPYPHQPHKTIPHEPTSVPNLRGYRELIMDGSLELVNIALYKKGRPSGSPQR